MEQEMSPWSIGMLSDKENFKKHKTATFIRISTQYTGVPANIESTGMKEDIDKAFCIQRRKSHLARRIPLYVVK